MKNRVVIELCDKEYSLLADESEEYVKSLAAEVNRLIDEAVFRNTRTSKSDAALLTCLDLCDKNLKLTEANDNMRMQIASYIDDIAALNKKLAKYERQKGASKAEASAGTHDEE